MMKCRTIVAMIPILTTAAAGIAADSPWLYGIHWFGPSAINADVADMTGGKPIYVLETVITNEGAGFWGPQGQLSRLQNVVSQGHTLICRVQPVWGKAIPLPGDTDPSMATFLNQVTQMATLYQDVCHIWHLGNEMNLDIEYGGQELAPEDYIEAAVQFSDRIHAVTSSLGPQIVLVGPLSPGPILPSGPRWMSSSEYLGRMCMAIVLNGYRDKFQGFAIHAYGSTSSSDPDVSVYQFKDDEERGFRHQLAIMDNTDFRESPVYITEWNRPANPTNGPDEAVSAQFLHKAFAALHDWNESGGHPIVCACWFVYYDWGGWADFALRTLKNAGSEDEDVWHAFQHAAQQNYPAGFPTGETGVDEEWTLFR